MISHEDSHVSLTSIKVLANEQTRVARCLIVSKLARNNRVRSIISFLEPHESHQPHGFGMGEITVFDPRPRWNPRDTDHGYDIG